MNTNSRTKNSTLNFIANLVFQAITILLAFYSRRIFIEKLGAEILGINGLFSNIIAFLSLAELGVGSAIYYSMYKEVANGNEEKICALTTYYKRIYRRIAITILTIGLLLLPFLRKIVKLENPVSHLEIYYVLSLINTVISYLFVYKTSVMKADQKEYLSKLVSLILVIVKTILQVVAVLLFGRYMIYILISVLFTLINNIACSKVAEKKYPFIKKEVELPDEKKKDIWKNIKDLFIYKFSFALLASTDNLLISILVSTKMVGYYSNYTMITSHISTIIKMFFNSIRNSLGNYNVKASNDEKYDMFNKLSFAAFWLYSFATIGIFFVAEDFIIAISGSSEFVLGKAILILVCVDYYINTLKMVISLFRETTGLFKYGKYAILIGAIINIVLSVLLGYKYGLFGIMLATAISRFSCDVWYEPYVLFKNIFKRSSKPFFIEQFKYILLTLTTILLMWPILNIVTISHLYYRIIVKFMICLIIPNLFYYIIFRKTEEFKYFKDKAISIFNGIFRFLCKNNK